jgi:hypothetical protein
MWNCLKKHLIGLLGTMIWNLFAKLALIGKNPALQLDLALLKDPYFTKTSCG